MYILLSIILLLSIANIIFYLYNRHIKQQLNHKIEQVSHTTSSLVTIRNSLRAKYHKGFEALYNHYDMIIKEIEPRFEDLPSHLRTAFGKFKAQQASIRDSIVHIEINSMTDPLS